MGNIADIHTGKVKTHALSQMEIQRLALAHVGADNLIANKVGFWSWKDTGVWENSDDNEIKRLVMSVMPEHEITSNKVSSVAKLIEYEQFGDYSMGKPFNGINCLNGELAFECSQWTLKPHKKERYQISQIPVKYDPEATAPRFEQYLDEVFEGDDDREDKKQVIIELMGYTLLPIANHEKFVIMVGQGGNGKSKLLNVLEKLCGLDNVVAVNPDSMEHPPEKAALHGKLANIVPEIRQGAVVNDAALKAITSGEAMTAAHKFKHPFTFHPYSTCWFGTNHMPRTQDFSNALFRRACVIEFNRDFEDSPIKDPDLDAKLEAELPGILNLALHGMGCVIQRGRFTDPESSRKAVEGWRLEADQVRQFVDDRCQLSGVAFTKDFFESYLEWAHDNHCEKTVSKTNFKKRLLILRGVSDARVTINSIQNRGLRGVSLRGRSEWTER